MLQIVQAFDRAPIAEIPTDDAVALEAKLDAATRAFQDRDGWPKPHERIAVLRRLAGLVEHRRDHFAQQIAREGGKPLSDAVVEVSRAIDGVLNAAEELRTFAGREIPMGLTPASTDRWAFTTKEPIGVVVAISAFNHPLNLIVHQVVPAIAVGCPVIVKPASATPLSCVDFVALVHEAGLPEPWCQTLHRERRPCRAACDRSACRLPELHRLGAGGLVPAPQARARDPLGPGAWGRGARHRRSQRRSRSHHRADGQRRLLPRWTGLRVDAAHFRSRRHRSRVPGPVHDAGWCACASATLFFLRQRSDR